MENKYLIVDYNKGNITVDYEDDEIYFDDCVSVHENILFVTTSVQVKKILEEDIKGYKVLAEDILSKAKKIDYKLTHKNKETIIKVFKDWHLFQQFLKNNEVV